MNHKNYVWATRLGFVFTVMLCCLSTIAGSQVRREIIEGRHEVNQERREARREIMNADSPMERRHEIREGARQINRERREASRQIRRAAW